MLLLNFPTVIRLEGPYRDAGLILGSTQVELAVHVDITRVVRELEHPEGEGGERTLSVPYHGHCVVTGAADHKQGNTWEYNRNVFLAHMVQQPMTPSAYPLVIRSYLGVLL